MEFFSAIRFVAVLFLYLINDSYQRECQEFDGQILKVDPNQEIPIKHEVDVIRIFADGGENDPCLTMLYNAKRCGPIRVEIDPTTSPPQSVAYSSTKDLRENWKVETTFERLPDLHQYKYTLVKAFSYTSSEPGKEIHDSDWKEIELDERIKERFNWSAVILGVNGKGGIAYAHCKKEGSDDLFYTQGGSIVSLHNSRNAVINDTSFLNSLKNSDRFKNINTDVPIHE